jgi:glycosyltransferase involved in cell wall biosynthesis
MVNTPIISVFMPVYNGEKYLRKSIESVLNQTFRNFQLVIVDDSSTDNSYFLAKEYSEKDDRIEVFQKPNGGNVPKSWNFAMPYLKGEFISYMSQDDWMSEDNLELNYKRYLETGADIVVPDLIFYSEKGNKTLCGINGDRNQIITGKEAFLLSLYWKIHGFTLCKAEIMKSEPFDETAFNSDEYVTRKNYLLSDKVAFSKGIFYYYQDNNNAITKVNSLYQIERLLTDEKLIKLMDDYNVELAHLISFEKECIYNLQCFYIFYLKANWNNCKVNNDNVKLILSNHFSFLQSRKLYKKHSGLIKISLSLIMSCKFSFIVFSLIVQFKKLLKKTLYKYI